MTLDAIVAAIPVKPYHQTEYGVLYCADCLDILKHIPEKSVDLLVTDPPYGVQLGELTNGQASSKNQTSYDGFADTVEYVKVAVVPAIISALSASHRGIITPGTKCMWLYPQPDDIGVWYNPAGLALVDGDSYLRILSFITGKTLGLVVVSQRRQRGGTISESVT